jgi:eukaryotic-like serine/threonine-protein kinase
LISIGAPRHHGRASSRIPASIVANSPTDLVRQLGPYQLLRKIGSGGMAEVWSARVVAPGGVERHVAIKVLASHLAEREEYREMFLGEARLSMMLSHPNIVQVFDAVAHEADCYMVMELVSGMTLSQLERNLTRTRERLPLVVTAYIIGELLRALSYAHQVRTAEGSVIVHRDVSPQNVMVTAEGQVKLMDFGIARFATQETQGSFVKGKLQYMPPEQLRKQTRKPTVDLYAVGAILHELLDGKRFRGKLDQGKLLSMIMSGEVPPLRHEVPAQIDIVRQGLLEPEEDARIQTARKALGMLCRWPDYREAASDLRMLVLRFVEPAAAYEAPEGSKVSSVPEGSYSGLPAVGYAADHSADDLRLAQSGVHSDIHSDVHSDAHFEAAAAAQTEPTGSELTGEELELLSDADVVAVPAPRERRRSLPFLLVGLGLTGAIAGGLFVLRMSAGDDGTADQAQVASEVAPEPEPTLPEPTPEASPEPTPEPGEPAKLGLEDIGGAEDTGEPEDDGTDTEDDSDDSEASDAGPRVSVPVEFVANEFFFVYVKVGGKVLTLEPRARLELPAGRHAVFVRESSDDKWVRAGRITVEPGADYRVEMRKPAGLRLVKK